MKNIILFILIILFLGNYSIAQNCDQSLIITRLDGVGAGNNFLQISKSERERLLSEQSGTPAAYDGNINYCSNGAPFNVHILHSESLPDGTFKLLFDVSDPDNYQFQWKLFYEDELIKEFAVPKSWEQAEWVEIIHDFGFSIGVYNGEEPGITERESNGALGHSITFKEKNLQWLEMIEDKTRIGTNEVDYLETEFGDAFFDLDPFQAFSEFGSSSFGPMVLCKDRLENPFDSKFISPGWWHSGNDIAVQRNTLADLNNVDLILTPDKSKWSRCVVVETANPYYYGSLGIGITANGNKENFEVRNDPSLGKTDADADGIADPDGTGNGMSWFPGYAIDVETGTRLNVFFGENSAYGAANPFEDDIYDVADDMMWNPTNDLTIDEAGNSAYKLFLGGQHYIYVTKSAYDECQDIKEKLNEKSTLRKADAIASISWAGLPILSDGFEFNSFEDGLIPTETTIQLRVDNTFAEKLASGLNDGAPAYSFSFDSSVNSIAAVEDIDFKIIPNPARDVLSVQVQDQNMDHEFKIQLFDVQGKMVLESRGNEIDVNHLARGPYVLKLISAHKVGIQKVLLME